MKKLILFLLIVMMLLPSLALAGRSTEHSHKDRTGVIVWDTQFKPETSDKNNKVNQLTRLSDNNPYTVFNYTQWKSERTDSIPELTAYTGMSSVGSIGLRNGDVNGRDNYYDNARLQSFRVVVYCSSGVVDQTFDVSDEYCTDYQIFPLKQICRNVSQVDIYLCDCYQGSRDTWNVCISDLCFFDDNGYSYGRVIPQKPPARKSGWNLQFLGINSDPDDPYTWDNDLYAGDTVYFHARLTGGKPSEKILLYYEITMNGEFIESSAFNDRFGTDSLVWVRNTPLRYGTLSVRIFYYEHNGNGREIELANTSIQIRPRDKYTQTETARGWISGCDMYFNSYGSFCIDLTNYAPSGNSIIFFTKNNYQTNIVQGAVSNGLIVWDTPVPGWIYEYAIWCGDPAYSQDAALLSQNQIPASAWIKISVTEDRQIYIVSSYVPINILPNK